MLVNSVVCRILPYHLLPDAAKHRTPASRSLACRSVVDEALAMHAHAVLVQHLSEGAESRHYSKIPQSFFDASWSTLARAKRMPTVSGTFLHIFFASSGA